jgi:hypothetical protein
MAKRNSVLPMTLAAAGLCALSALGAWAQVQSSPQQACLNAVNKNGAAVAKTQGKENVGCVKAAGKAGPTGAQACLTADAKGKVAKAKGKTTAAETKSCGAPPSFGYTSAATVNAAAQQASLDLTADVYGANLDAALVSCATDKAKCGCQQKVSKDVEALAAVKLATFVGCKKAALKAGINSSTGLANCVSDGGTVGSIAADSKGKIGKSLGKLTADVGKACDAPGVTGAFPGTCTALVGPALVTCLDTQVECRVCQAINEMDGLFVNCDAFDNGVLDASCASGTGPTPTPVPTTTATPVPGFQGALTSTIGRFNYNLTVGLPGANAACNSNFPGSHACTLTELQAAESTGDLVGAQDIMGNTITSFWAIDPTANPLTTQCHDDVAFPCPGGICPPGHTWAYGTAHTPSRGQRVPLNNGAGTLGALQTNLQCNFSGNSWVGCCI